MALEKHFHAPATVRIPDRQQCPTNLLAVTCADRLQAANAPLESDALAGMEAAERHYGENVVSIGKISGQTATEAT
jgi:hypothetical protein